MKDRKNQLPNFAKVELLVEAKSLLKEAKDSIELASSQIRVATHDPKFEKVHNLRDEAAQLIEKLMKAQDDAIDFFISQSRD